MANGPAFTNSYNITNRMYPFTWLVDSTEYVVPLPGSELYFYESTNLAYDPDDEDYNLVSQGSFLTDLQSDLELTVDGTGHANLVVYIHGLGNTYSDAIIEAANLGTSLQHTGYGGLVIGFSWPSYSDDVAAFSSYYATSRPPQAMSGTIRDNINGSVESFNAMLAVLQSIQVNNKPVNLSVICHSEGNFMLTWGMQSYPSGSPTMNNAIMLAADISASLLQTGQWGDGITKNFNNVNVYFSAADSDLAYSDYEFFSFHEQTYPTRLGLIGPFAYPIPNGIPANVTGIDCSQVTVNLGNPLDVHSSYFSLPSVLADMTAVLSGSSPSGRTLYPGSSYEWYYLNQAQAVPAGIKANLWSGKIKVRPVVKRYFFRATLMRE